MPEVAVPETPTFLTRSIQIRMNVRQNLFTDPLAEGSKAFVALRENSLGTAQEPPRFEVSATPCK